MSDLVYINGNPFNFNAVRLYIYTLSGAGGRWYGWKNIDFGGEKRERAAVPGALKSGAAYGITEGDYTAPNPKITFVASSADADRTAPFDSLTTMMANESPDGRSYGNTQLYMLLQVIAQQRAKYEWLNVFLTEPGASWEKGPEGLFREVGFTCARHKVNGNTLYDSTEEPQ
jgi:hypothetical protein